MRRRGLFQLAERYGAERLTHENLPIALRVDITVEMSRTFVAHAEFATEADQAKLWKQGEVVLAECLARDFTHSHRLLVEAEQGMAPANIGRMQRLLADLSPGDAQLKERAADRLVAAIEALAPLDARIAMRLKNGGLDKGKDDARLTPAELKSLLSRIRWQRSRALVDLAALKPKTDPHRLAQLAEAQKILKSVGDDDDAGELIWEARLSFVESLRFQEEFAKVSREYDALLKLDPPESFRERLIAERIRVHLAQSEFASANRLIESREIESETISGELLVLSLEAAAAETLSAKKPVKSRLTPQLLATLEERAARIDREFGGYWSLRSRWLMRQLEDARQFGPRLAELTTSAREAFAAGDFPRAIELYGEASAIASSENRGELAFQFGFTRGSIEIKAQKWPEAYRDLLALCEAFPRHPKCAEAHLLAAYAATKQDEVEQNPALDAAAVEILEEHCQRYANDPTCAEAIWMLAVLHEQHNRLSMAIELFQQVPQKHTRRPSADLGVARCYEKEIDELRSAKESVVDLEQQAIVAIERLLPDWRKSKPSFDRTQIEIALRFSRIILWSSPPQYERADALLVQLAGSLTSARVKDDGQESDKEIGQQKLLLAQVRQLQIISLAGRGKFNEARDRLREFSAAGPAELLRILDGLAILPASLEQDPFRELGELQLEAAKQLEKQRNRLSRADLRRLDECLARGYFASGKPHDGFEIYDALVEAAPRDRELLSAYSQLLTRCGSPACLEKLVAIWQKIEKLYEPGTRDWYPARYEYCKALVASGNRAEALKLLQVTRLVFPAPPEAALQKRFADLEAEAGRPAEPAPK